MTVRLLQAAVLLLIVAQRLAVPVGGEQLAALVPLGALVVIVGLGTGVLVVHRRRAVLVGIMVLSASALTLMQVLAGGSPSLLSLALFVVLWSGVVLTPRGGPVEERRVGIFFVRCMGVFAAISLAQYALQAAGIRLPDVVGQTLPPELVLQDFNTVNPVEYGSSIERAAGFVFLEPSFLSLFLGVAVVLALRYRMRWPITTLLLLGIVPTVAGNGIVVLALAIPGFLLVRGRARLAALVPAAALAVAAGLLTPLGSLYLERSTEGGGTNSSTGLRLVQPYVQLVPQPLSQPFTALFGRGAGSARDWIVAHFREPLLATVFPKTLFEFGVIGVLGILLPLVLLLCRPLRHRPELLGLVFAFLVVNDSLLAAVMVQLALIVLLWLPEMGQRVTLGARDERRAPASPSDSGPTHPARVGNTAACSRRSASTRRPSGSSTSA